MAFCISKAKCHQKWKEESFFCFIDSSSPVEMSQYWPRSAPPCKEEKKKQKETKNKTRQSQTNCSVLQSISQELHILTLFRFCDLLLDLSQIGSKEIASWIEMCDHVRAEAFIPPLFSREKVGLLSFYLSALQLSTWSPSNLHSYCIWIRKNALSKPWVWKLSFFFLFISGCWLGPSH